MIGVRNGRSGPASGPAPPRGSRGHRRRQEGPTNPLGVHALVWVGGWSEAEARRAIEQTSEVGFDLVEIPLLDPTAVDADMTAALLAEYGIEATCSLGLDFGTDISSDEPETVARGERLLGEALSVARDIGSSYLGGVVYSAMGKYTAPPTERGWANAAAVLGRLADRAAGAGITIGLEPANRYETNLVNTAEQALALIDDAGADNLVVHLDAYHMQIEEGDLGRPVRRCAGRLGYVHVGESHRGYLGAGSVDLAALFRALDDVGYRGPIVFESFSSAVVSEQFASALAVWRDLWTDGRALAEHAKQTIEAHLVAARHPGPPAAGG